MQLLPVTVIPAVRAVGLHRRDIAGLRGVFAGQHKPIGGRFCELIADALGVVDAACSGIAVARGLRPYRLMRGEGRRYRSVLQGGINVLAVGGLAADPHVSGRSPGVALQRSGHFAVADHGVVELQLVLGEAKAGKILIDQQSDRLTEIGRRLAFGEQHVVAVEAREVEPITLKVRRRHDVVGREIGAEQRQIEAGIPAIGLGHA
jgi:hypothetical protein